MIGAALIYFQSGLRNQFQFSNVLGKEIVETIQPVLAQSDEHQAYNANALQALGELDLQASKPQEAEKFYQTALGLYFKEQDVVGLMNTTL